MLRWIVQESQNIPFLGKLQYKLKFLRYFLHLEELEQVLSNLLFPYFIPLSSQASDRIHGGCEQDPGPATACH